MVPLTQSAFSAIKWKKDKTRPNFLLILSDDQGAQMGALGTPELVTPNMDAMASEGVLFRQAFVASAPCSPTRSAIMTSQYPHTNNTRVNVVEYFGSVPDFTPAEQARNDANAVPDNIPTLIEKLVENGYRTGIASKFHQTPHDKYPFHVWIDNHENETDGIQEFMEQSGNQPWFLLVSIRSPHRPFSHFQQGPIPNQAGMDIPGHLPQTTSQVVKDDYAAYLRAVQRTDIRVGEALQAVQNAGQDNRTISLFLGDQGPAYHRAKGSPYDFGLRTPFCVKGPASYVKSQPISGEMVSALDVMPTILDYAGIAIPPNLQGKTLRPILEGQSGARGHDYIFGEIHQGYQGTSLQERSVYDGRYRLIFRDNLTAPFLEAADNTSSVWGNYVYNDIVNNKNLNSEYQQAYRLLDEHTTAYNDYEVKRFELYDVETDKWEINDLYDNPLYSTVQANLKAVLRQWIIGTKDTYVDPNKLS